MEMEAPRRSAADRSRELSMKKPRLSEEAERPSSAAAAPSAAASATGDRIRPYAQARPAAASSNPRFRANEREREDREETGRGGTSYQQQDELVAQYKTALAELTFNSKPIITNLTIIAGENLHAAKAVASTVCANVLEVPREQKLPSLYLLDSIVKNIGRDYIKYFAARLPEVFCKAYKQVDPSIHSSMRHLFGTWKGIFSSSCLQLIEKELGFSPIINGSSGGTVMRSDTQAQRPLHSIHVNPKYLEARQRFQQSARGEDLSGEDLNEAIASSDAAERSYRIPSSESMRQWPELSNKVPNVQRPRRDQLNDFIHERKGYKDVRATVCSTHPSRQPDLVIGGTIDQVKEPIELDKPYSGAGGIAESTAYRRNGFDATHAYGSYRDLGSAPNNSQLPSVHPNSSNKMNWPTSKNWKNSEEEEYIWDDTGSRSGDYEGPKGIGSWSSDDQDKPTSLHSRNLMSMETEQVNSRQNKFDAFQPLTKDAGMEERIPFPRDYDEHYSQHHNSQDIVTRIDKSAWPMCDTPQPAFGLDHFISRASGQAESRTTPVSGVLSTNDNSALPRSGFQSSTLPSSMVPSMDLVGTGRILGLQRQLPLQSSSPSVPSVQSAPLQQQKPRGLADQDYLPVHLSQVNEKSTLLAGQFNRDPSTPITNDAFPILSENPGQQGRTTVNAQPSLMHASQHSSFPFPDLKRHLSSLQQSQTDPSVQAVQKETSTSVSQGFRANHSKGFSGAKHNSSIDVSGESSTSNLLAATKKTDPLPNNSSSGMWNLNIQPPLPSGPPPAQAQTSSSPLATSTAEMPSSHQTAPALALPLQGVLPPLPPGPPPSSSLLGASAQTTNSASIDLNPLSSLLSSLVAKGLITSTATQLPIVCPSQMAKESPTQNSDLDGSTSSPPSSLKELPASEPSTPGGVSLLPSATTKFDNLIGIQFKTEIVREFHPSVIDSLLDDLKHQCYECGLRFRHEEQLEAHLDWHNLQNSELSSTVKMCRRWYSSIINWVSGDVELACGPSLEAAHSEQPLEPMVTADERQSVCALCGEPFEDFYSVEKDEWMYKGTVYLNLMDAKCVARGVNGSIEQGPIVHAKCISPSTDDESVGMQS